MEYKVYLCNILNVEQPSWVEIKHIASCMVVVLETAT